MAQVSGTDTEAARAPARAPARHQHRATSRRRGLEIAGLVLGIAAGVTGTGTRTACAPAGSPDIDAYPAGTPWGPFDFTEGRRLYRDPSIGLDDAHDFRIMYEARAEPALSTPDTLVISYNVNSEGVDTGCVPMAYYTNTVTLPRFVTVPLAAFGPGARQRGIRPGQAELARRRPGPALPHLPARAGSTGRQPGDHRIP